jgi:hypothetical protein
MKLNLFHNPKSFNKTKYGIGNDGAFWTGDEQLFSL